MRVGEASKLKWENVDLKRHIIILNNPEKNSNPRIFNNYYMLNLKLMQVAGTNVLFTINVIMTNLEAGGNYTRLLFQTQNILVRDK